MVANRTCVESNEYKDQTSEIAALKTEMSLLKDLMVRQVGYLY